MEPLPPTKLGDPIDLKQPFNVILNQVQVTKDLGVLLETMNLEKNNGNRGQLVSAIHAQMDKLSPANNQGNGSEAPHDDELFDASWNKKKAPRNDEFDMGDGSLATPQTADEVERLTTNKEVMERRIGKLQELASHKEKNDGTLVFSWGHIFPPVEKIINEKGYVDRRGHDHRLILNYCPRCGKPNHPNSAVAGVCANCDLDFIGVANQMIEKKLLKPMVFEIA